MNIYVSNISFRASEEKLRELFEGFGEVSKASIISDKYTGRSRGFGFVEMPNNEEAAQAIAQLNGTDFLERTLNVKQAEERPEGGGNRRSGGFNKGGGGFNRGGNRDNRY